jgi:surface protein
MNTIKLNSISLNGNSLNSVGEGKIVGENYNEITCFYELAENATIIIFGEGFKLSQVDKMWIDGVNVPITKTFALSRGKHKMTARFSNLTKCFDMFYRADQMVSVDLSKLDTSKVSDFNSMFARCSKLKSIDIAKIDTSNGTDFSYLLLASIMADIDLSSISLRNTNNQFYILSECHNLENLNPFWDWTRGNISLEQSETLSARSLHLIIERASSVADGAEQRTLYLHPNAKANWEASEYYDADIAMANEKLITIA